MTRKPANALRRLFDAQKSEMNLDDLDWFSGLADEAITQASNLSDSLSALAMTISGGTSSAPADDQLVNILFGLASQAETVSALTYIGSESEFLKGSIKAKSNGQ